MSLKNLLFAALATLISSAAWADAPGMGDPLIGLKVPLTMHQQPSLYAGSMDAVFVENRRQSQLSERVTAAIKQLRAGDAAAFLVFVNPEPRDVRSIINPRKAALAVTDEEFNRWKADWERLQKRAA